MGKSDAVVVPWFKRHIKPVGKVALLGFANNNMFAGDCYDRSKGNWEINSDWTLPHTYDTVISLRCPYFASNPGDFVARCAGSLGGGGRVNLSWSVGDHWRFPKFRVGWKSHGVHEWSESPDNKLWSCVWDDTFLADDGCKLFASKIKAHGYDDLKRAIYDEVPKILLLSDIKKYFEVELHTMCTIKPYLQLYFLITGVKK